MEHYIHESLEAGITRPSSSPVGAGFFFMQKKDKSLRLCNEYWGLNQITIKNKYPLPLIMSAFEPIQGVTIFTKLDLHNAYHLVRIGGRMEDCLQHTFGPFWILGHAIRPHACPAVFFLMRTVKVIPGKRQFSCSTSGKAVTFKPQKKTLMKVNAPSCWHRQEHNGFDASGERLLKVGGSLFNMKHFWTIS